MGRKGRASSSSGTSSSDDDDERKSDDEETLQSWVQVRRPVKYRLDMLLVSFADHKESLPILTAVRQMPKMAPNSNQDGRSAAGRYALVRLYAPCLLQLL